MYCRGWPWQSANVSGLGSCATEGTKMLKLLVAVMCPSLTPIAPPLSYVTEVM